MQRTAQQRAGQTGFWVSYLPSGADLLPPTEVRPIYKLQASHFPSSLEAEPRAARGSSGQKRRVDHSSVGLWRRREGKRQSQYEGGLC